MSRVLTLGQIVISSGKTDWIREVTDGKGTLAGYMWDVVSSGGTSKDKEKAKSKEDKPANGAPVQSVAGVFDSTKAKRVTIQNGSHRTVSDDHDKETVLVFPDYKVVTEVDVSKAGAEELWDCAVSPSVALRSAPESKGATVKSWILPYACVILLCALPAAFAP